MKVANTQSYNKNIMFIVHSHKVAPLISETATVSETVAVMFTWYICHVTCNWA